MENNIIAIQDRLLNENFSVKEFSELFSQLVVLRENEKHDFHEDMK